MCDLRFFEIGLERNNIDRKKEKKKKKDLILAGI
jgi:hypothetical protein